MKRYHVCLLVWALLSIANAIRTLKDNPSGFFLGCSILLECLAYVFLLAGIHEANKEKPF
jgi:hypothetical protein